MTNPNLLRDATDYLHEQRRLIDTVDDEEIADFVFNAIHRLTTEHFEPTVHNIAQSLPEAKVTWLGGELRNGADNVMVNPDYTGLLPASTTVSNVNNGRFNGLLIPDDSGLLKIQTKSNYPKPGTYASMKATRYSYATRKQAEDYRETRAGFNDFIDPNATMLVPAISVQYEQYSKDSCRYEYDKWHDPDASVIIYTRRAERPTPEGYRQLHRAFMHESEAALAGLSILLQ